MVEEIDLKAADINGLYALLLEALHGLHGFQPGAVEVARSCGIDAPGPWNECAVTIRPPRFYTADGSEKSIRQAQGTFDLRRGITAEAGLCRVQRREEGLRHGRQAEGHAEKES